ncbi:MAG TPA: family 16 glycosylhydrolase [Puia sp.]|jgi:beta-glucanase (GH16 family)|nr:family 16 glycosylhydrolase [Puia sp.]
MARPLIFLLVVPVMGCSKGDHGGGQPNTGSQPSVKVTDVTQARQTQASAFRFYIDLSAAGSQAVSVSYATSDGTAKAGVDYTAESGTITIPAGQTEVYVDVPVSGDSLRRANQTFSFALGTVTNAVVGTARAMGTILNTDLLYLPTDSTGYTTPASYPGRTLVWSDEFNGNALNTQDWNYEQGGSGWGNNELENYTNRTQNVFVSAGHLVIEARQESYGGNNYTSGRLTTQGKRSFTYGRIDIRAKLPVSKGMWPALWMLGSDISTVPWPGCGETDIMELIGTYPGRVTGSLHWQQSGGSEGTYNNNYNLNTGDFSQQFHVYSIIWQKDSVQFLVDDQPYVNGGASDVTSGTYPFNSPFFFIFNVAVGGNWPGPPDGTTVFPQRMFVDYVRVFQ